MGPGWCWPTTIATSSRLAASRSRRVPVTPLNRFRGCLLGLAAGRRHRYDSGIPAARQLRAARRHDRRRAVSPGRRPMDRRHLDGAMFGREPHRAGRFDARRSNRAVTAAGWKRDIRAAPAGASISGARRARLCCGIGRPVTVSPDPLSPTPLVTAASCGWRPFRCSSSPTRPRRRPTRARVRVRRTVPPESVAASRLFGGMIWRALHGASKNDVLFGDSKWW